MMMAEGFQERILKEPTGHLGEDFKSYRRIELVDRRHHGRRSRGVAVTVRGDEVCNPAIRRLVVVSRHNLHSTIIA